MSFVENFMWTLIGRNFIVDVVIIHLLGFMFADPVDDQQIIRDPDMGIYLGDGFLEIIVGYYIIKAVIITAFTVYYYRKGVKFAGL